MQVKSAKADVKASLLCQRRLTISERLLLHARGIYGLYEPDPREALDSRPSDEFADVINRGRSSVAGNHGRRGVRPGQYSGARHCRKTGTIHRGIRTAWTWWQAHGFAWPNCKICCTASLPFVHRPGIAPPGGQPGASAIRPRSRWGDGAVQAGRFLDRFALGGAEAGEARQGNGSWSHGPAMTDSTIGMRAAAAVRIGIIALSLHRCKPFLPVRFAGVSNATGLQQTTAVIRSLRRRPQAEFEARWRRVPSRSCAWRQGQIWLVAALAGRQDFFSV